MDFLFTINEKYVNPIQTLLYSIYSNVGGGNTFWFINDKLSTSSKNIIEQFAKQKCKSRTQFINFPYISFIEHLPIEGDWSREIYFRLFAPYLLQDVKTVVYLDGDTIVTGNLEIIHKIIENENYIVAGVANDEQETHIVRLGLDKSCIYINSGVMVINLSQWRARCSIQDLKKNIIRMKDSLMYPDQDFINILWKSDIYYLPRDYNYMISLTERNKQYSKINNPQICHYVYTKPWLEHFYYKTDGPFLKYLWKRGEHFSAMRLYICHRLARWKWKISIIISR